MSDINCDNQDDPVILNLDDARKEIERQRQLEEKARKLPPNDPLPAWFYDVGDGQPLPKWVFED